MHSPVTTSIAALQGRGFRWKRGPPGGFECVEPPEPDLGPEQPSDARCILPFDFKGNRVRVVIRDGEPIFLAKDVTDILGYANGRKACAGHCKAAIPDGVTFRDAIGREQKGTGIPERDVYRLVMRSHLPAAEGFEEWVVGTVLPSIRKNRGYTAGEAAACTASAD